MAIKENDDDSKHTTSNAEGLALRVAVVCMLARVRKTHAAWRAGAAIEKSCFFSNLARRSTLHNTNRKTLHTKHAGSARSQRAGSPPN